MSIIGALRSVSSLFALPYHTARRRKEQWLSPEELANLRSKRLRTLFRKALAAPYYRRNLPAPSQTASSDELLADVPILVKRILTHEGLDAFLTAGSAGLIEVVTSGSTGQPAKFLRSALEETEYSARVHRAYSSYGLKARDTMLNVGSAETKRRRGAATALRDLGVLPEIRQVFVGAPAEESVQILLDFKPRFVTGYTIGLENMADYILRHGVAVQPPKAVLCGAMDVTEHGRDLIERAFKAPAFNLYVCNELGQIAWECPERRGSLHMNDDILVIEILDEHDKPVPDGSPGELVVTSLTLSRMPLVRYRTGDIAARIGEPCSCGRGLGLMTPIQGRTAHTIVGPEGQVYTAPTIAGVFRTARAYEWVRRFQVREQENRLLLILVETHTEGSPEQVRALISEMSKTFGPAYTFRMEVRDELPLTPAGKYQFLVPLSGKSSN